MRSISWSLTAGTMGDTSTETGMPASLRARIASSRLGGVEARGSSARASFASSVVTESATRTRLRSASEERMSMSRTIRADFVRIVTG